MRKLTLRLVCAQSVACLTLSACPKKPDSDPGTAVKNYEPIADAYDGAEALDQGWSHETRTAFYNTPQGSMILPYPWLVALEQADNTNKFIVPANIERFRYLARKPTPTNPDGLPVGWTRGKMSDGQEWFGLNCSACHTAQLAYTPKGAGKMAQLRIDGGPTLANFNLMNEALVAALHETLQNAEKFKRFADAVIGETAEEPARDALRGELQARWTALNTRNEINKAKVHYGFGRIDAIGFIFNQTMSVLPKLPENARPSDAPASYPFLWGTDQSDVVQWTGFSANANGKGTIVRNGGEVVGVYGQIELTEKNRYTSSLDIVNLGKLEDWVRTLNSPAWPDKVFPKIDATKAERGAAIYKERCASCHQVIPRSKAIETGYEAVITPLKEIGTDSTELCNMLNRQYTAGIYAGKKTGAGILGDPIPDPTKGLDPLINAVTGALADHLGESLKAFMDEHATHTGSQGKKINGYKARPLNGIWATAPYLHNGSVPSLYELLLPRDERSKTFTLGSREYDPVRVGFRLKQSKTGEGYEPTVFDTTQPGNLNAGHEFASCGTLRGVDCAGNAYTHEPEDCTPLTDDQRWDLVEYMKTL